MTTATHTFAAGDRVVFAPDAPVKRNLVGLVFTVERAPSGRQRNYWIKAVSGSGTYSVKGEMLAPAPAGDAAVVGVPFEEREFYSAGEIVTLNERGLRMLRGQTARDVGADTPMVVLKDGEKTNVTKLGGWEDRYLRMPPNTLTKRDLAWATERLVELA